MIYKISPNPSLPKRGEGGGDFAKEGKRKARNDPLDYAKIFIKEGEIPNVFG